MTNLLILYAHPNSQISRVNRCMIEAVKGVEGVVVRDLYELYPAMFVDTHAEQKALAAAHTVVFQFPFHWFSAPSLLKEWQDSVLNKGFAFGPGGDELAGKQFMLAVSAGGEAASYAETRPHGAPIQSYFQPFEQTARFCGMTLLEPFVTFDVGALSDDALEKVAKRYRERVERIATRRSL